MNYATKTLDSRTFLFNTGRRYTEEGQIVGVHVIDANTVYFYDVSRMIDGLIRKDEIGLRINEHSVLSAYDSGNYENWPSFESKYVVKHLIEENAHQVAETR